MSFPRIFYYGCEEREQTNPYIEEVIKQVPLLTKKYKPPPVWGKSGHVQTALYSVLVERPGLDTKSMPTKRHVIRLSDSSSVSYDVFPPSDTKTNADTDITLMVCPGLANSSESSYIRAFALQATALGYRVAALNHLGVVDEPLTSPRLFTFGSTEEYGAMVQDVLKNYPSSKLISVGFSLGGSLVCKYLGEDVKNQEPFIACLSLCQGFDFHRMKQSMEDTSANMRRFYAKQLTNKVRENVVKHWDTIKSKAFPPDSVDNSRQDGDLSSISQMSSSDTQTNSSGTYTSTTNKDGSSFKDHNLKKVMRCKLMPDLDECITIKLTGHETVDDYYTSASSCHHLQNINLPTLFVNSKDDPLYSRDLLAHPERRAKAHIKTLFVLTTHGGHLGFFTKTGSKIVDPTTWLEEVALQYINAVVNIPSDQNDIITNPAIALQCEQRDVQRLKITTKEINEVDINGNIRLPPQHVYDRKSHHEIYNYLPRSWSAGLLEEPSDDGEIEDRDSKITTIRRVETTSCFDTTV